MVAENFGKVLVSHGSFWSSNDISFGNICILTASWKKINEEVWSDIGVVIHKIGLFKIEDDWIPFRPFMIESQSESEEDENNEESISNTWEQIGMDHEEGEVR